MSTNMHKPEPDPIHTDTPEVWPLILADLAQGKLVEPGRAATIAPFVNACRQRDAFGRAKYGVPLQVENGRHPLRDALGEALDLMAYTRQNFERVKRASPNGKNAQLKAWQLHLAACAVAVMVVDALTASEAP